MPAPRISESKEMEPARLTLFDIELAWLELIQARREAEEIPDAAERESALGACDQAIGEYVQRETAKVDGIRGVVRGLKAAMEAAKQERDYQAKRAQSAEAMITRIKGFVQSAMEASGKKRIEGRTGYLSLKGNGGVQALEITDPAMLPDECCRMEGWISVDMWACMPVADPSQYDLKRAPDNAAIRAALAEPCPPCKGSGNMTTADGEAVVCKCCGGSGRNAVPGARLAPRGEHVEIR